MSSHGKFSANGFKDLAIALSIMIVLPVALPVLFGAIWGVKAGVILGALSWFAFGMLGGVSAALKYGSNSRLGKIKFMIGFPIAGALLGWIGGSLFAGQAGVV